MCRTKFYGHSATRCNLTVFFFRYIVTRLALITEELNLPTGSTRRLCSDHQCPVVVVTWYILYETGVVCTAVRSLPCLASRSGSENPLPGSRKKQSGTTSNHTDHHKLAENIKPVNSSIYSLPSAQYLFFELVSTGDK